MAACGGYAASTGKQRVVVLVDPYSSGRYLVHELQQQRWPMVGVQSSQDLSQVWLNQFDQSLFVKSIRHESLETTVSALEAFEIVAVMAGSEPGVLLTEDLQKHFKVSGNDADTKVWRRDKAPMQERLREVGVRAIHQICSSDVEEILKWQKQWNKWPIIVKPPMSGGTDGVYWCHDDDDVRHAHKMECGKLNINGVVNSELLAQEFLDGDEYIIDCVSHKGKHVLSGIWVYKKKRDKVAKAIVCEYCRIVESTGEVQDKLVEYTFSALDALGIREGPSHSEVMMTDSGPCLIETGARMHGLKGPKVTEFATGIGTHELAIDVAVNGARMFNDLLAKNFRYTLKKWVFETLILNYEKTGVLSEPFDAPIMAGLHSVTDVFPSVEVGQKLPITRDLASSAGMLIMVSASLDAINEDIAKLRHLEATTLFKVREDPKDGTATPKVHAASPFIGSPVQNARRKKSFGSSIDDFELEGLDPPNDV